MTDFEGSISGMLGVSMVSVYKIAQLDSDRSSCVTAGLKLAGGRMGFKSGVRVVKRGRFCRFSVISFARVCLSILIYKIVLQIVLRKKITNCIAPSAAALAQDGPQACPPERQFFRPQPLPACLSQWSTCSEERTHLPCSNLDASVLTASRILNHTSIITGECYSYILMLPLVQGSRCIIVLDAAGTIGAPRRSILRQRRRAAPTESRMLYNTLISAL